MAISRSASHCHAISVVSACLAIASSVFCFSDSVAGENFRIETKVFHGKAEEPASEAITLFYNGDVYDFLKTPSQIAIFRKPNGSNPGRFILLDKENRIKTEISTDRIEGAIQDLKEWAGTQKQEYLKFSADPDFKETFEPGNGQLVLVSHIESYTVFTEPAKRPKAAAEYREFLDWYARLNTLLSGGPPPQPRLELNAALSRHKALPQTVELRRAGDDEPLRAEHRFTWMLSQEDMTRIENARGGLASYREVDNQQYLQRTQAATD